MVRDFSILPNGDGTIVGERGISLSGGQRARISLARAVYKEADIYLLDDPLSAVDTNVGQHLFDHCITGYLHHKVVVLVTHQLQYLKEVDQIVVMNNGFIQAKGTFLQLQNSGIDFVNYMGNDIPPTISDDDDDDNSRVVKESNKIETILKHVSMTSAMKLTVINPDTPVVLDIIIIYITPAA